MNFIFQHLALCFQEVVIEFNIGIDSRAATPHKHVVLISQRHAVIETAGELFNRKLALGRLRGWIGELDRHGVLNIANLLPSDAQLTKAVESLGKNAATTGQETHKSFTADDT